MIGRGVYKYKDIYSDLNASIGFNFAALYAGRSQNTIPTDTAHQKESATTYVVMYAATPTFCIMVTTSRLNPTQINHPNIVSTTDSVRNCSIISRFLAPIDLRIPISRVLSDTDTSMMFITPIPHTRSDIAAIPQRNNFNVSVTLVIVESISAELIIEKLALPESASLIWNLFRKMLVIFVFIESIALEFLICTAICERY
ncbi:MAG: hypothetical protein WCJ81_01755 [bacterium]